MQVVVRARDTLWQYSRLFQVPIVLIADSNPNVDPQSLTPGMMLQIPGYVTVNHSVKAGDSLWRIAGQYGMPLDALLLVNPGINPAALRIGQVINIPRRVTWLIVETQQPYNYAGLIRDLERLANVYPFIRRSSIGSSVMGKPIPEILIGRGEKKAHVNGSFHGNEWITTPILVRFANEYLMALTNAGAIRGRYMLPYYGIASLSVVPMVNPDGVDLVVNGRPQQEPYRSQVLEINGGSEDFSGWKANIRGVDLNNQYPAQWEREAERGPRSPAPRDYAGTGPLTEPESIAIAELTRERDFDRVLAFHTQGEVIYWGYENLETEEAERLVNEFARVSGYQPIRYAESFAGFKDWFIQDWRRPGYTIEVGRGTNPLPLSQLEENYQKSLGILLATLYA
jgi:g-D-glutamyl-meso-diaminopimelate peptidase